MRRDEQPRGVEFFAEMSRYLFTCAYDGAPWLGWQSQAGGGTVQDCVEEAMRGILKQPCRIHAAGRTDAGVHALGQCFHADLPENHRMDAEAWLAALNANLPASVRILHVRPVGQDFHARFSALGKTYEYRICRAPVMSPFWAGRAWHRWEELDEEKLRRALSLYVGTHDFRRFAARRGNEPDPIPDDYFLRTLDHADFQKDHGEMMIRIRFHGNGFLYRMVRFLVAYAWGVGTGRISLEEVNDALQRPERKTGPRFCAPADGLYLVNVDYPEGA